MSFLTQLDRSSHPAVEKLVCQHILGRQNIKSVLGKDIPKPVGDEHLQFEGYWITKGSKPPETQEGYVLTPSVRANLKDLVRVVTAQ